MTIVMPVRQELREQLPELAARHRIDAGGRLVEQDQRRLVDQRAGERELLLHAARKLLREPPAERRQPRQIEQPVSRGGVVANAVNLGKERDVLVDAQIAVEAELLRQVSDRAGETAMVATRIETEDADGAAVGPQQAADRCGCVVVLPAPSGPIRPNISPRSTDNDSSSNGVGARRSAW